LRGRRFLSFYQQQHCFGSLVDRPMLFFTCPPRRTRHDLAGSQSLS
jgi:hypothetical protein